ncbi:hypothetical protein MKX08_003475 [Trichoderma sp. CBMAI-0020]|nr:hypothetical protein MKX08_003475 [Trichoderma sp. CBMAI-0020]
MLDPRAEALSKRPQTVARSFSPPESGPGQLSLELSIKQGPAVTCRTRSVSTLQASSTMDEAKLKIVLENPIGTRLDAFRDESASMCGSRGLAPLADAFDVFGQLEQSDIAFGLFGALQGLRALRLLPSPRGSKFLLDEILLLRPCAIERLRPWPSQAAPPGSPPPLWRRCRLLGSSLQSFPRSNASSVIFAIRKLAGGDNNKRFGNIITRLGEFAAHHRLASLEMTHRRKLLAQPRTPLIGSTGRRSMDIGFVNDDFTFRTKLGRTGRYRWSHVLVPGELKSNPIADAPAVAWIDLATYAREVLSAQDTRRFVLAFTLCGSNLRLWEYDRVGGIASEQFNINEPKGGREFVATVLGFLWIDEQGLGFDPTIMTSKDTRKRFIEIERDGKPECLIIDEVIARYYYHETVHVGGAEDEVQNCIRKGLGIAPATADIADTPTATTDTAARTDAIATTTTSTVSAMTAIARRASLGSSTSSTPTTTATTSSTHRRGRSAAPRGRRTSRVMHLRGSNSEINSNSNGCGDNGIPDGAGTKRGQSEADLATPAGERPAKRSRSGPDQARPTPTMPASHISINNLVIDEDGPPERKGFVIDLDLAIREQRIKGSGTKGKTGTRAFMAIGVLFGERHSFMHDLESFFWVLFWTCIHYDGPNKAITTQFDEWNYAKDEALAGLKIVLILTSERFCKRAEAIFTPFYSPLIPVMDRLRAAVFPGGKLWEQVDEGLYASMREILLQDQE